MGLDAPAQKKKNERTEAVSKKESLPSKKTIKATQPEQPKTYHAMKENNAEEIIQEEESPALKARKSFLMLTPLCSGEQIGVLFMLIHKYEPSCIEYIAQGEPNVHAEKMSDSLVGRLSEQLSMWGVGYVPKKKR